MSRKKITNKRLDSAHWPASERLLKGENLRREVEIGSFCFLAKEITQIRLYLLQSKTSLSIDTIKADRRAFFF